MAANYCIVVWKSNIQHLTCLMVSWTGGGIIGPSDTIHELGLF